MSDFDPAITEFTEMDPTEIHLVGTPASLFSPLMAKSSEKGNKKVTKKEKLEKAVEKAIAGLAGTENGRLAGAEHSAATVRAAHGQVFGRMPSPFKPFEDRLQALQAGLAKAIQADNGTGWEVLAARRELHEARQQLTAMKMMVAEGARANDPSIMARRLNGQGVPLISNRHALPDDSTIRYA